MLCGVMWWTLLLLPSLGCWVPLPCRFLDQIRALDQVSRAHARIVLSRPEERWKGPAKQDSVGCMLGFYIVTCDRERDSKFNDGRSGNPNMETHFVPMHSGV